MNASKKQNKYFIDTNIFLRALIKDNKEKYDDILKLFEQIKNNEIKAFTSSFVLAEIVWTLSSFYKISKKDVIETLVSIKNLNGLEITEKSNTTKAIELYEQYNVKYIDCVIYTTLTNEKKQNGIVVSYDTDFDKLGAKRIEPKDLLV